MRRSRKVALDVYEENVINFENDYLYEEYVTQNFHTVDFKGFPYLCLADVEKIYTVLNGGSRKGITNFLADAKGIAEKTTDYYLFKNEENLFKLFKKQFGNELSNLHITSWGELMAFVS